MGMVMVGIEDEGIWRDTKIYGGIRDLVPMRLEISRGSPRSGLRRSVVLKSMAHSDCSGEKC